MNTCDDGADAYDDKLCGKLSWFPRGLGHRNLSQQNSIDERCDAGLKVIPDHCW